MPKEAKRGMKTRYGWAVVGKNNRITKWTSDDSTPRLLPAPGELCIYPKRADAIQMGCDDEHIVKVLIKEVW